MPENRDDEQPLAELRAHLAHVGIASARQLCQELEISQASFSRLAAKHEHTLLTIGRGRATRYAARRVIADVEPAIPVHGIDANGDARRLATLHPVLAEGFWVESHDDSIAEGHFADLPYFLNDLRPAGYLGRLIPVLGVAPLYDMTPALYAVAQGNVRTPPFEPSAPTAHEAPVWDSASRAAQDFWQAMAADERVSEQMRAVAAHNRSVVERWREVARHLPR